LEKIIIDEPSNRKRSQSSLQKPLPWSGGQHDPGTEPLNSFGNALFATMHDQVAPGVQPAPPAAKDLRNLVHGSAVLAKNFVAIQIIVFISISI
jgi:hypothetical protein